jgi:adenylate kinase
MYHVPAISTGELLRAEVRAGSALGKRVQAVIASGAFVSDHLVTEILLQRIQRSDCRGGFLLDGYPRTLEQATTLDRYFVRAGISPVALHIDVPEDTITARITARRQCPMCHHIYNLISQRPIQPNLCDIDGTLLVTRPDDKEDVIRARLRTYHELTGPAIDYYKSRVYFRIDGSAVPELVFEEIKTTLQGAAIAHV